ncbi:MAG TPA: M20/M25/M40 family metallo-hydrolase [Thermoanaerobaculaceae bacterium]|nr:M20/M25/M40 family metallo-hydrolase [Thermoanaerobaculaceae bacterium]
MKRILAALALALVPAFAGAGAPAEVRARAREIFEAIIAFRTSVGLGQVPVMAEYLARTFEAGGFAAGDVRVVPLGETASLVVRYRGTGEGGRPIALLAHMDVVTARREEWRRDPFVLVEENGYFFGRGTLDIKCEVALLTATFLRLKAERFVPTRDLIIAFSGDEETEMATSRDLVRNHRDLVDAEFALNGDGGEGILDETTGKPLVYHLQGAEKAIASYEFTVHNPGGHSSYPRADNAIYELADALKRLQAYHFPVMWNEWTIASLRATAAVTPGALGEAMRRFAADPRDAAAADAIAASPQNVGRTRTTCVATMLRGGHADNALPQSATATVNCRIFPATGIDEVRSTLEKVAGAGVEVTTLGHPWSSGPSPMRSDVVAAVAEAVHASWPGVEIVPDMVPYATEGSVYRAAGIPTYGVCSQFIKDSDVFSHGLDERLPVASFYAGLDHWYVLLKALAGTR